MAQVYFRETQRFTQWWVWVIIAAIAAGAWYGAYVQLIDGRPFGSNPAPDGVLALCWLLFGIGMPLLFSRLELETEVRDDGVYVRFFPFHLKFRYFPFSRIESAEARAYAPLLEYGGWGIRIGPAGRAYNVKGRWGVQLLIRAGQKLLIGTQEPHRLASEIASRLEP